MSDADPRLDAIPLPEELCNDEIPLPGELASGTSDEPTPTFDNKRPKLRCLQYCDDGSQVSSIAGTKVMTQRSSIPPDPASDLAVSCSQSSVGVLTTVSSNGSLRPQSQTIVDALFEDFLASKKKEEVTVKIANPGEVATSMEEMSRLLDAEISLINSNLQPQKTKGRWDSVMKPVKQEIVVKEEKQDSEVKLGRWDSEVKKGRWDSHKLKGVGGGSLGGVCGDTGGTALECRRYDDAENGGKKSAIKLEMKLEIRKESLDWINSGDIMDQRKNKVLEEGEVLSSSSNENSNDTGDDSDLLETGSISSDKASKKKKKHKHKHKHKKKKKHKKKEEKEGKKKSDGKKEKKEDKVKQSSEKRKKSRSRSRSKSQGKKRRHSRSQSHDRHSERYSEWDARNYGMHRDRSRSPEGDHHKDGRHTDRERDRDGRSDHRSHGQDRRSADRHRDRSREMSPGTSRRRRDRKRQDSLRDRDPQGDLRVKIDKSKLRKIAIANVLAAVKAGEQGSEVDLATLKAGGKSVEELTDFCKKISEKERGYTDSDDSDSDYGPRSDAEEGEGPFINHPFKLRDMSAMPNIVMNIRNSRQLPVLTPQAKATQSATLRLQFPVSSGSQHRQKEAEWVPVEKTKPAVVPTTTAVAVVAEVAPSTADVTTAAPEASTTTTAAEAAAMIATGTSVPPVRPEDRVFPDPPAEPIDIGKIVSERVSLVRKLTENPYDVQALTSLHHAQEKASQWAQSKYLPGMFTGSTGAQTLTQEELAGPNKRNQAWIKKDQLRRAAPVAGGIGMWLLQKMGWKQGEGLGKNNEGSKEPLMLDVKVDRRGLTSDGENTGRKAGPAPRIKDLSGKHPVSALTELCIKRRWNPPNFQVVQESGPDHKKNFLFKVIVNGVEYQPATASANKKLAKAQSATVCLQEMGLVPRT